ncbi:MAG: DNA-binding protein [Planctomycetia bacterium]|nr:DNA-binding protein [Planctomycetia bacterium]
MAANELSDIVVVCDAGPLIHLDELGCLDLLSDFREVLVPSTVWREVETHRPTALANRQVAWSLVSAKEPRSVTLRSLVRSLPLHAGELEALQVASERRAQLLLTDDTAARLAAQTMQLPVHGTIGILFRAIRRRQLAGDGVAQLLRSIPSRSTLHIKHSLLEEFIQLAVDQGS